MTSSDVCADSHLQGLNGEIVGKAAGKESLSTGCCHREVLPRQRERSVEDSEKGSGRTVRGSDRQCLTCRTRQ